MDIFLARQPIFDANTHVFDMNCCFVRDGRIVYPAPDIRGVLFQTAVAGKTADIHRLMLCYERADWDRVRALADRLQVEYEEVTAAYLPVRIWEGLKPSPLGDGFSTRAAD